MREILFKAKRVDNGEWVEGYLAIIFEKTVIIEKESQKNSYGKWITEIDPETICQFTGLCDKNGNRIWENDICDRKEKYPEVVKMNAGDWTLDYSYLFQSEYGGDYCNLGFYATERKCVQVIGNIFDNPELLEAK